MLRKLRFLWHFRKGCFVQALAEIDPWDGQARTEQELWALYQLGLHETVAQAGIARPGWRGMFAKAVAHAACGQFSKAHEAVVEFRKQEDAAAMRAELAVALTPFMPSEALQLLEGVGDAPPTLRVAVLMRNGLVAEARHLLEAQTARAALMAPELHLLRTNASGGTPDEQLQHLNSFLRTYNLPALRLVDSSLPPSPQNLEAVQPSEPVRGPLVTVLMTTFNTGARAIAAIESVLAQSYRNIELIVLDDASSDETAALVEAATAGNTRVQFVALPRNVGTYAAKRVGLALAQGEFVTCHDSDDWSHPEKIARQVAPLLADERLVCSVSNWVRLQDDGIFYARPVYPLTRLNPSSPLFRRERVLREAGAWDCVRTGADSEFLARLRLVFGSGAIKKIGQPLALGSHRSGSLMTAACTGYSDAGLSPQRLAYWEAWERWHIECVAAGKKPFIDAHPRAIQGRPFPVPERLLTPAEDIAQCALAGRLQYTHS